MQAVGSEVEGAFRSLYDRTHAQVTAYCLRRCPSRSDAHDAVAETYVVAWRRFREMPDGDAALLWLFATARRVIANLRRSHDRQGRLSRRMRLAQVPEDLPDDEVIASEEHRLVLTALGALSDDDQELLRLTEWEQLPRTDVAELLGCSRGTVDVRLHRARRRLAAEYSRVAEHGRAGSGRGGERGG